MSETLLGRKIRMTQCFAEDGVFVPLTALFIGLCPVVQVKSKELDGYDAVQIGFEEIKKAKKVNKPRMGHFKKSKLNPMKYLKEFRIDEPNKYKVGDILSIELFNEGDFVDVIGISKGKGFAGGMKRWNWAGTPETHGSTSHRRIGSVGSTTTPGRVYKGHSMPGRMGSDRKTTQNLKVIKIDKDNNIMYVRGSVVGCNGSLIIVRKSKKKGK